MAFQIADRVKETTTTTGTGTLNLSGAVSSFVTFVSGIGNGNETYYSIEDPTGTDWEVGIGTVTSGAPDTLSRDTVISSSNGGSLVNFGAGEKVVFSTQPASKTFILSSDNTAVISNINASTLTAGTVNDARLSANVTLNNASTISTGTLAQARLANSSITINGTGVALGGSINVGDITGVTAGDGLTGGGTTGAVTLNVGAGTGIDVTADAVAVDVSDFMTNGANNRIVTATGTDGMNAETNLTFDGSTLAVTGGATFTANVALGDLDYILMGPTGEYQIYHDHANGVSIISDADTGGKIRVQADNIDLTGPVVASSTVNAATFNGSGAGLTTLNASNLSSGTIPDARFPATIPASSGANLTNLNASNVSSGTLPNARLSAVPNSALDNSSITINGTGVSLGGSISVGDITGVTAGDGLTGGGTTGAVTLNVGAGTLIDVAADTVSVDLSELTTSTSDADGDFFCVVDSVNAQKKLTKGNINLSGFNNDAGFSTTTGTVTSVGVTAGSGLTGGGTVTTSGTVTLNVGAGTGVTVAADTVSIGQDVATSSSPTFAGATFTANVSLSDNDYIRLGTSQDLLIYHSGSNSIVRDNGTGDLWLGGNNVLIRNAGLTETYIDCNVNGSVDLFYDNAIKLATTSGGIAVTGAITATGDITAFFTSDETLKTNIENIKNPMDKVMELNGVYYDWTEEAQAKYDHLNGDKEIGVIAQQVEKVLPEMVGTRDDGTKAVRYERMCALLIECVKDLQNQVNELKGVK